MGQVQMVIVALFSTIFFIQLHVLIAKGVLYNIVDKYLRFANVLIRNDNIKEKISKQFLHSLPLFLQLSRILVYKLANTSKFLVLFGDVWFV